jgi:hypothetical protein
MTERPRRPRIRRIAVAVAVTWAGAVVGVVAGIWAGDWRAIVWALNSAICAAGWWIAVRQWLLWRSLAFDTLGAAGTLLGTVNPPEDESP